MAQQDLDDLNLSLDLLMTLWPETITVFLNHKMLCIGCLVNPFHTVIDACREYDLDEAAFRVELHQATGI